MVCTQCISYLNKKQAFVHSRLGFVNTGRSVENKTVIRAENTNSSSKNLLTHHVPGQWLILYSSFFAEWSLKKIKKKLDFPSALGAVLRGERGIWYKY